MKILKLQNLLKTLKNKRVNGKNEVKKEEIKEPIKTNQEEIINKIKDEKQILEKAKTLPEEIREKYIDYLNTNIYKVNLINTLSEEKREKYIYIFTEDYYKSLIIKTLDKKKQIKHIKKINDLEIKISLLERIYNEEILKNALFIEKVLSPEEMTFFRKMTNKTKFIEENIEYFLELEDAEDIKASKEILQNMKKTNSDIYQKINFKMLDKKMLQALGEDKINLISCFSKIQDKIVNMNENEIKIFTKCLNYFMNKNNTTEWAVFANKFLDKIPQYQELISDIKDAENRTIEKLTLIMQNDNLYEIKSYRDLENYDSIKIKKCNEWIESNDIEKQKLAVFEKIFGHDTEYAKKILSRYGKDIKHLPNSSNKYYIKILKEINNCQNKSILKELYKQISELEFIDRVGKQSELKNEYANLYNKGLLNVENCEEIGDNIYSAGTNFNILMTSVGAFIKNNIDNYRKDWNRASLESNHYCASYIRNDMIGVAPINNICYGFSSIHKDTLVLSSSENILSRPGFISTSIGKQKYYSPEKQIKKTDSFNEMDIKRVKNGRRIQPDYILVFKKDGKISNIEQAKKASKDWKGKLPIIVVDVDLCLQAEKERVQEMINEYMENNSPKLAKQIMIKIRNNRVTDKNFANDVDIQEWKKKAKEKIEDNKKDKKKNVNQLDEKTIKIQGILKTIKRIKKEISKKNEVVRE